MTRRVYDFGAKILQYALYTMHAMCNACSSIVCNMSQGLHVHCSFPVSFPDSHQYHWERDKDNIILINAQKLKMSQKSEYNARFSFEDPLSKLSLSRSSRYRIRKRKRCADAIEAAGEPCVSCDPMRTSDAELDYFATVDSQGDDSSSVYEFEDENKSTEEDAAERITMDCPEFSEEDELDFDGPQEAPADESEQTA